MYLFSKIWQTVRTKYLYYNGMEFWYINNSLHEYFGGKKNFKIISQDISYFPWVGLLEYFFWGGGLIKSSYLSNNHIIITCNCGKYCQCGICECLLFIIKHCLLTGLTFYSVSNSTTNKDTDQSGLSGKVEPDEKMIVGRASQSTVPSSAHPWDY